MVVKYISDTDNKIHAINIDKKGKPIKMKKKKIEDDLSNIQLTGKIITNVSGEDAPYINGYSLDGAVIDYLSNIKLTGKGIKDGEAVELPYKEKNYLENGAIENWREFDVWANNIANKTATNYFEELVTIPKKVWDEACEKIKNQPTESISESGAISKNAWDELCKDVYNKHNKSDITTVEDFNLILENRLSDIRSRLAHKGDEYSTKDRLHNFKLCSRLSGNDIKETWRVLFVKHLACIWDMIDGHQKPTKHLINEKIGDAIPYLILLEAILLKEVEDD